MVIVPLRTSCRVRYRAGSKRNITFKAHLHFEVSVETGYQGSVKAGIIPAGVYDIDYIVREPDIESTAGDGEIKLK